MEKALTSAEMASEATTPGWTARFLEIVNQRSYDAANEEFSLLTSNPA